MKIVPQLTIALLAAGIGVAGCAKSEPTTTPAAQTTAVIPAAPSVDDELARLKTVTPVDACALLPPEKLAAAFPGLRFEVRQKLEPRMSGYTWDSRCTYWAGVGSMEFAKDTPTHTFDIFVNTVVSEDKAKANLKSRHETATTSTGYQAQTTLGPSAYTIINTGVASLFFTKGQAEIQLNTSDLNSKNDEKVAKLIAIAQAL